MRGALNEWKAKRDDERIIPADAGSTYDQNHGISRIEDHPRGCGEHLCAD